MFMLLFFTWVMWVSHAPTAHTRTQYHVCVIKKSDFRLTVSHAYPTNCYAKFNINFHDGKCWSRPSKHTLTHTRGPNPQWMAAILAAMFVFAIKTTDGCLAAISFPRSSFVQRSPSFRLASKIGAFALVSTLLVVGPHTMAEENANVYFHHFHIYWVFWVLFVAVHLHISSTSCSSEHCDNRFYCWPRPYPNL